MTPAEQARALVEEWAKSCALDARRCFLGGVDLDVLVERLTPVFERAAACDDYHAQRDAQARAAADDLKLHFRERMTLERERDEAVAQAAVLRATLERRSSAGHDDDCHWINVDGAEERTREEDLLLELGECSCGYAQSRQVLATDAGRDFLAAVRALVKATCEAMVLYVEASEQPCMCGTSEECPACDTFTRGQRCLERALAHPLLRTLGEPK